MTNLVVYCRESSLSQRPDLLSRVAAMQQFCLARGLVVDDWVQEIGGGMDLARLKFLDLVSRVVHTFSCRLYGLRRDEETLKNDDLAGGPR